VAVPNTRRTARWTLMPHGWVDLVVRSCLGLWVGCWFGLGVAAVAIPIVSFSGMDDGLDRYGLDTYWWLAILVWSVLVGAPVGFLWFLADFPAPFRRRRHAPRS
jgi:hypothetical protein